jgi:hypothetical protein
MKRILMIYASPALTIENILFIITHLVMICCIAGILYVIRKDWAEPQNAPWLFNIKIREKFARGIDYLSAFSFKVLVTAVKMMVLFFL